MATIQSMGNVGNTRLPAVAVASALAQYTVKFIAKAGTYSAVIQSPQGDIIQEYKSINAQGMAEGLSPSFQTTLPVMYFQCSSSRTTENTLNNMVDIKAADMRFFVNGQQLAFGSNDICIGTVNADGTINTSSNFTGMFKRFDADTAAARLYPGLQILKDVADAFGHASGTVRMEATIRFGTQSDTIQADFPITVRKAAGETARVAIESLTPNCFAIREKGETCALIARVYLQGILADPKTMNATYEWFRLQSTSGVMAWVSVGSGTYQQGKHVMEITDDMIDTTGIFMVKVSGLSCGDLTDTQTVSDLSDPYVMDVAISPEDMCIYEDDATHQEVTFTPTLRAKSGTPVSGAKHYFTILDAAGNILNDDTKNPEYTAGQSNGYDFRLDITHCLQAGGDVNVVIEATTAKFATAIDISGGIGNYVFTGPVLTAPTFDAKYASTI